MDSYLQLSPDSSVEPHTPPSTFDMDDMNNHNGHPNQPQEVVNPYPAYDDAHSQFWNHHHDPRGAYMQDQFYDDRIKLENAPSAGLLRGPQSSAWPEHDQDSVADPHYYRRASFPQVRHDHAAAAAGVVDPMHPHAFLHSEPGSFLGPYSNRSDAFYGEPMSLPEHMPLSADPSALHGHPLDEHYLSSASASPHSSIHEFDALDSTHSSPVIVPTQAPFYRAHTTGGLPHPPFLNPHAALPVMHTDDAASKETQYLRRRCFNCHTTEPPSWRRSTLNPGKIVCNKCGLYERTHLRPRPHRFDELRAGSKARKAAANKMNTSPGTSPKPKLDGVKKEASEGEFDISASSIGGGAVSDWETSSAYSTSSTPNSGFPSPIPNSFTAPLPLSRPSSREGPIRLPNAPLTDIATRLTKVPPAKSSSAPYYVEGRSTTLGRPSMPASDMYPRRGSLPVDVPMNPTSRLHQTLGMPEVTGWQVVPPPDLSQSPKKKVEAVA